MPNINIADLLPVLPDALLLLLPFLVIGSRLFCNFQSKIPWRVANVGFIAIFILLNFVPLTGEARFFIFNWKVDDFGILMREVFVLAALLGIWLSKDYFEHGGDNKPQMHQIAEFIGAIAFATFGGIVVISSCDILTLFLGLEIATIPMYALTAWNKKDQEGSEAATKYILMGSVATAFELFGFSYIYGFAGSLHFDQIQNAVVAAPNSALLWISVLFLFSGIGFKLTLFPFYTWAPDVYEGAPTPVTAVLSVTSKATAVAFLVVLIFGPLAPVQSTMAPMIALLACTTLVVGNLGALKQKRLRRFMAYSSISQAGYMMIALLGSAETAKTAIIYYMFVYAVSNYLAFFVFAIIGHHREETFDSLKGLSKQNPSLAISIAIAMFSLAGIPPLAGFFGKFHLFFSGATGGTPLHYMVVAFAVLNNVLVLFYYLQLIKSAWIDEPDGHLTPLRLNRRQLMIVIALSAAVVVLGILPFLSNNVFNGLTL